MKGIPEDRALMLGQYIVDHGATVRSTAAAFGFSKSLVHKDDGVIIRIEFQGMRKAPV